MKCDTVIMALALAIVGVALYTDHTRNRNLERVQSQADSLSGVIAENAEAEGRQRQAESLNRLALEAEVLRLKARHARIIARTDTLLDTLVLQADTAGVRRLIESERRESAAVIAYQDSTIQWMGGRIAYWRDTALTARSQQLEVSQRLLREALQAKRPSHLVRGMLIGGAVVGAVSLLR